MSRAERSAAPSQATSSRSAEGVVAPPAATDAVEPEIVVRPPERNRERDSQADAGTPVKKSTDERAAPKSSRSPSAEDWLGLYRGNDTTVFLMPDQPDRSFDDPKAKIRIESHLQDQLTFALVDSTNDKDICQLIGSVKGDEATINPGQSCFLDPDESMTVRSRPGKATRNARHLVFDLVLDTTLETDVGDVSGSIEYHFEGDRQ